MLEDEPKFEVMKLFQHFDKDGSGVITFKNLKEVLNEDYTKYSNLSTAV